MNEEDIKKGLAKGWLIPDVDGWYRFVYDFEWDPIKNNYIKIPSNGIKRVRLIRNL